MILLEMTAIVFFLVAIDLKLVRTDFFFLFVF